MSRVYEALRQAVQEAEARARARQEASDNRHGEVTFPSVLETGVHRLEEKEKALRLLEAKLDDLLRRLETSGATLEALLVRAERLEQSHRIGSGPEHPEARKALHQQVGQAVLALADWTEHCKGALQASRDEILEGLAKQVAELSKVHLEKYRQDAHHLARDLRARLERAARIVGEAGLAAGEGEQ